MAFSRFDARPCMLGLLILQWLGHASPNPVFAEDSTNTVEVAAADDASAAASQLAAEVEYWNQEVRPFLQTYCYDCHSGEGSEADIDFSVYDSPEQLTSQRPRWNQVRGMLEIGAMPPADYDPLPELKEREVIADWIDRKINSVDCNVVHDPGRVTLRRLNRVEYDNTLRDLLGVDFSVSEMIGFPSDDVGNGFDNQGDVLTLSPLQLEKYLAAAQTVTDRILVLDPTPLLTQQVSGKGLFATEQFDAPFDFAAGSYRIEVSMEYGDNNDQTVPVALLLDGQEIQRWDVGGLRAVYKARHDFPAGQGKLSVRFVEDPNTEETRDKDRRILIEYLKLNGPKDGEPVYPLHHQRIVSSVPSAEKSVEQAALEIFQPMIRRAFRREPREIDVSRVVGLVKMASEQGESFPKAVSYGIQSILVSPNFLFRIENTPSQSEEEKEEAAASNPANPATATEALNDYALASRLSYFLWASMPDDELLDLARDGQLHHPETLKQQSLRMLKDPKSKMLVERFFGQMLGLGNLKVADPDKKKFPLWNDRLRDAMRKETHLFCQELIQEDLPLTTLLNGNFTFVNPRLAELYGMQFDGRAPADLYQVGDDKKSRRKNDRSGVYEDEDRWIRVELPSARRGVLTQASILTLTSHPTTTSPVKRGTWILENIFGDPPPPAPPNVPAFGDTQTEHGNLSLREQLAIHRANPSCASCHNVMDPLGLGFEHYDPIGSWRDKDNGHEIDAAGKLADGRTFNGSNELVALLESSIPQISRHFSSKLLTYALGRGLEPYDYCAIDDITASAAENEYRLSSFVQAVVTSEPFSKRRIFRENQE